MSAGRKPVIAGLVAAVLAGTAIVNAVTNDTTPSPTTQAASLAAGTSDTVVLYINGAQVYPAATSSTTATTNPATTASTQPATTSTAPATTVPAPTTTRPAPTTTAPPASTTTVPATTTTTPPATTTTTVAATTTVPPAGVLYSNDFSAATDMTRVRFDVHRGTWDGNYRPVHFMGDHDMACAAPPTVRPLDESVFSGLIFYCAPGGDPTKGHFMTAMDTESYNIISISPLNGSDVVFPASATRFCFDVNRTFLSGRKWIDIDVISESKYRANGNDLSYVGPGFDDLVGNPIERERPASDPLAKVHSGDDVSIQLFGIPGNADKATRLKVCLTDNGNGTLTLAQTMPSGAVSTSVRSGRFPAGPRVFILQDESYNPEKDNEPGGNPATVPDPYTWHFDNVTVSAG